MDKIKRISVIMGIYNCADTLAEAVESLLSQTYTDWELIMCDDCSTDDTIKVADSYASKYNNIHLIRNPVNQGLAASLNHCLSYAKGEYIARMDGDDISLPDRLALEVSFLENHNEYAMVSCAMMCFDENGVWGKISKPERPTKKSFVLGSPFNHAPILIRKYALNAVGNYTVRKELRRGQDYYLWHKLYKAGYVGYNMQEAYYMMRDDQSASNRGRDWRSTINEVKMKYLIFKGLKIPFIYYLTLLRPLVIFALPTPLYVYLHKKKHAK